MLYFALWVVKAYLLVFLYLQCQITQKCSSIYKKSQFCPSVCVDEPSLTAENSVFFASARLSNHRQQLPPINGHQAQREHAAAWFSNK